MKRKRNAGVFVISLDFELFWGVADIADIAQWENDIKKVYDIVPRTLDLFEKYGIHATWATVAGIMLDDYKELLQYLPEDLPEQTHEIISKFNFSDELKSIPDYMLFGNKLVQLVKNAEGQEIGTHTFTHYYCDKKDSNIKDFLYEMDTASLIMKKKGYGECNSVVFPRNQVSECYVHVLPQNIYAFRGSIPGYIDKLKKKNRRLGTLVWYLDHYLPLQNSAYSLNEIKKGKKYDIKLSRLFKAYKEKYRFAEKMKIWRYKKEMEYAAKKGKVYHICWHPHNFSRCTDRNFEQLEDLLIKFKVLEEKYGMVSMNMDELRRYLN